jgi:lysophospholipase L1-like esterase
VTGQPISVAYGTPTVVGGAPGVLVTCSPQSGSMFPIGSTSVVCTATDARSRTNSCSFNVVVQQPPRIALTQFEAFGDSITWGEDGQNDGCATTSGELRILRQRGQLQPECQVATGKTYPESLAQLLAARYVSQLPVVANAGCRGEAAGSGFPGEPAPDGYCYLTDTSAFDRFRSALLARPFQAVLLMEGANDIFYGDAAKIDPAISGLRAMIEFAKSRSVRVFVATIPPQVAGKIRTAGAPLVPALNSRIRSLAQAESVTLVDVWAAFGSNFEQYIGFDGLHPTESGYEVIANAFFAVLKASLDVTSSTTTVARGGRPTTIAVPQSRSPYSPPLRRR